MILVTFYSIFCAVAIASDLLNRHWVAAFCVAVLCGAAYAAGEELQAALTERRLLRKLGRAIAAVVLIAIALYLSTYRVHLVLTSVSGLAWAAIGLVIGVSANSKLFRR